MKRLLCWVVGHDWNVLSHTCHRVITLAHLHPMAGTYAVCRRCQSVWEDRCDACRAEAWVEAGQIYGHKLTARGGGVK